MSDFWAPNCDNPETGKSSYFNKHNPCASPFRAPHLNRWAWPWLRRPCSLTFICTSTQGREGNGSEAAAAVGQVGFYFLSSQGGSSQLFWLQSLALNPQAQSCHLQKRQEGVGGAGELAWAWREEPGERSSNSATMAVYDLGQGTSFSALVFSYLKLKFWTR